MYGQSCPRAIEESVLGRIRDAQPGMFDSFGVTADKTYRQVDVIQSTVERIGMTAPPGKSPSGFMPLPITTGEEATK